MKHLKIRILSLIGFISLFIAIQAVLYTINPERHETFAEYIATGFIQALGILTMILACFVCAILALAATGYFNDDIDKFIRKKLGDKHE